MNDSQLRELLHDTQPPAFDASGVADGARRVAHRRGRTQRAVLGGVTGVAVVALAIPLASQLVGDGMSVGMTASEADDAKGGAAPDAVTGGGPVRPVDAGLQDKLTAACEAPEAPAGLAGPSELIALVVCGPNGASELSASDFALVLDDLAREVPLAESSSSTLSLLGRLGNGDFVYLRLSKGVLDFGAQEFALGQDALSALERAAR
ncbi:MAG TPA: hypothetical protein VLR88_00810 [Propionibacteriaceae bacterium]|nr:hypothetical protein [Propionibacteriaceae bacterium]